MYVCPSEGMPEVCVSKQLSLGSELGDRKL
jgi:hypothetical protein